MTEGQAREIAVELAELYGIDFVGMLPDGLCDAPFNKTFVRCRHGSLDVVFEMPSAQANIYYIRTRSVYSPIEKPEWNWQPFRERCEHRIRRMFEYDEESADEAIIQRERVSDDPKHRRRAEKRDSIKQQRLEAEANYAKQVQEWSDEDLAEGYCDHPTDVLDVLWESAWHSPLA